MRRGFKKAKTSVFWDVEDFPNPNDGRSFYEIIKSALRKDGYRGEVSIIAYGWKKPDNLDDGIAFVPKRTKYARLNKMLIDISFWAMDNPEPNAVRTNLMFIAKNIPKETDFVPSLIALSSFNYNVLLVVADDCVPERAPLPNLSTIWFWGSLLAGAKRLSPDSVRRLVGRGRKTIDAQRQRISDDFAKLTLEDAPCPFCVETSCRYCGDCGNSRSTQTAQI